MLGFPFLSEEAGEGAIDAARSEAPFRPELPRLRPLADDAVSSGIARKESRRLRLAA